MNAGTPCSRGSGMNRFLKLWISSITRKSTPRSSQNTSPSYSQRSCSSSLSTSHAPMSPDTTAISRSVRSSGFLSRIVRTFSAIGRASAGVSRITVASDSTASRVRGIEL